MSNYKTLQHTEWDCKYDAIFIPKYRRKVLYGMMRAVGHRIQTVPGGRE